MTLRRPSPSAARAATSRVPTTVPKMVVAKLAEPKTGVGAAKPPELIVERRGACSTRGRYVFVPGRVRLAVPLSAKYGASPSRVLAYLLFDGARLEISAALADAPVFVSGERASGSWRAVPVPSVLRVGDEEFDVRTAPARQRASTSKPKVVVRGATVEKLDPAVLGRAATDPEITVNGLPIAALPSSTDRHPRPAHRAQTTGSRRWRRLALLSGALASALATMLFMGGPPSLQALPHVGTAQAGGPSARPTASLSASASASTSTLASASALVRPPMRAGPPSSASTPPPRAAAPPSPPVRSPIEAAVPASAQSARAQEGTTLERRAADLFARGAFNEAATAYRELAHQHPERPIFTEAAAMATQHAAR